MTPHQDHEQRLTNLEVKTAFSEDQIDQLDQVIVRQQQQIDALIHQVRALRERQLEDPASRGIYDSAVIL